MQSILKFLNNKIKKIIKQRKDVEVKNALKELMRKESSFIIESGGNNLSNGEK